MGCCDTTKCRVTGKGFNKEQKYWDIMGVATLDYFSLYRKHTFVRRESYKLDYIGEVELGEKKNENLYMILLKISIQKIINSLLNIIFKMLN